jgi:quercetin dioxygenase-like cupin family protein
LRHNDLPVTRKGRFAFARLPARGQTAKLPPIFGEKSMKAVLIAGIAVLAAGAALLAPGAAWAQSGGQMAVPAGPDKQVYDVPAGSKDQEIIIQTRDLKDGETVTPHIHHGVEMTEVVTGTFELYVKGQPMKVIHAGESFLVPREAPHDARPAPGSPPVHLAVTLVIDKGTAPRSPVTDVLIPKK